MRSEIVGFRGEILRAEQTIRRSHEALDSCLSFLRFSQLGRDCVELRWCKQLPVFYCGISSDVIQRHPQWWQLPLVWPIVHWACLLSKASWSRWAHWGHLTWGDCHCWVTDMVLQEPRSLHLKELKFWGSFFWEASTVSSCLSPLLYAFDELSRGETEAFKRRAQQLWLRADVSRNDFGERVAEEDVDQGVSLRDSALVEIVGGGWRWSWFCGPGCSIQEAWLKSKEETKSDP